MFSELESLEIAVRKDGRDRPGLIPCDKAVTFEWFDIRVACLFPSPPVDCIPPAANARKIIEIGRNLDCRNLTQPAVRLISPSMRPSSAASLAAKTSR